MRMRLSGLAIILTAAMMMLTSCRSLRSTQAIDSPLSAYRQWTNVTVPISLNVGGGSGSTTVGGRVKMVRGEMVDISLRAFGFEVGRMIVTPDSLFALVRTSKLYVAERIADVAPGFELTVGNLQSLLMGHPFLLGRQPLTPTAISSFNVTEGHGDEPTIFTPKEQPLPISYAFAVGADHRLKALSVDMGGRELASATYGKPISTPEAGELMESVVLSITASRRPLNADISWRWADAQWNVADISTSWNVPESYVKVSPKAIFKNLF